MCKLKNIKLIQRRKTQIAIEFCFRRQLQGRDVFWVHGSSDEAFGASFREIAQLAHLSLSDEDHDTLLKAVKTWFESPASGNWTIVIDNLDDIELPSRLYIPICRGEILFTTRDEKILGHPGLVPAGAGIEVSRMGEKEAMETFCRIIGSEDPVGCPDAGQLLTLLDGLPLAIAQAARYIQTTHIPIAEYLARFQKSEEQQEGFMSKPLPDALRTDKPDLSRAVMTTWQLTVQRIEQESPLSIKILRTMSFLDPDNLPSSFIKAALSPETENHYEQLAPLLNFGLLTRLESSNYRLHRLVSMWTRVKMGSEVKHQRISQATVLMLGCFPPESSYNVMGFIGMLPHAVSILDHVESNCSKFGSESSWDLQRNVIHFLRGTGQLQLAMKHATSSLNQENVFQQDEAKRYASRAGMGDVYYSMGDYAAAINEYQQALVGLESTLGNNHPWTFEAAHNMAIVLQDQGEYAKALEWYQCVLPFQEKRFGKDSPETLVTVHSVATVFQRIGWYDIALEWYQRALNGQEKAFGEGHPTVLMTVNNIAEVFRVKGEYTKALEWSQRVLDGREKALGKDHPETLMAINNMATVFQDKGEYDKALERYQYALDGQEKALGEGHPTSLVTVNNIAVVLRLRGESDTAMEWYQRALDGREKALGVDHLDTLISVNNIATVYQDKGEHDKALEWYQRALDGQEKVLGKDHPETFMAVNNMATVFQDKGEYEKALEWYQRALDGQEKALGMDHPGTLTTVNNMAIVFQDQGEHDKALEWYRRALEGLEKALGKDHPKTLGTVYRMAAIFEEKGECDKALEGCQRTLAGWEKAFGKDHPDTIQIANSVAMLSNLSNDTTSPHQKAHSWKWALPHITDALCPWRTEQCTRIQYHWLLSWPQCLATCLLTAGFLYFVFIF